MLTIKKKPSIHIVAERVGHSSIKVTADVYAHMLKDTNYKAADDLNDALKLN